MNGFELEIARRLAGKSKSDMAKAIGKCKESYGKKENGSTAFTVEEMLAVSDALGLSIERFSAIFFDGRLPIDRREADYRPVARQGG